MSKYKNKKQITAFLFAVISATGLYSCSSGASSETASEVTTSIVEKQTSEETTSEVQETVAETVTTEKIADKNFSAVKTSFIPSSSDLIDTSKIFTDRDLEQTADISNAEKIEISDNKTVDITQEGIYVIKGTASDCTIRVDAGKDAKIQLVLDGVNFKNQSAPAISVISAKKCFVTTTDSENTMEVTGTFVPDNTVNTDAVIFATSDLILNGTGSLNIKSSGNGITSKDELKITGGNYNITSELQSFEANDAIYICAGNFEVNSSKDGFHCKNSDDLTGDIYISNGTFNIKAASDGIQSTGLLVIDGGTFNIESKEGLESTYIQINDGTINISASDDGINASAKSNNYDVVVEFNGGTTTVVMAQGDTDGVDANGSIIVNGGTIDVTGVSTFDYDKTAELNGGTVIVNGEEVSEIPQSMFGHGGGGGGMHGNKMTPPDGMDGFDPSSMTPPDGMDGFDPSSMTPPDGKNKFDKSNNNSDNSSI